MWLVEPEKKGEAGDRGKRTNFFCIFFLSFHPSPNTITHNGLTGRTLMVSEIESLTSVVFIGNPGVGKSTLLNALGGSFKHGFNPVVGMPVGVPQEVTCGGRSLLLVDVPGVNDYFQSDCMPKGENPINFNLKTIRKTLNDGGACVIFFVVEPVHGTISSKDMALMKLVLESMEEGPQIGLIMTLIRKKCFNAVAAPGFVLKSLTDAGATLEFFAAEKHLFLRKHDKAFSGDDLTDIQDYILGFEPRKVRIREMLSNGLALCGVADRVSVETAPVSLDYIEPSARDDSSDSSTTSQESVIFIGSPGVGKSALQSALGANFNSVFRPECKEQYICCKNNRLRLINCPGNLEYTTDSHMSDSPMMSLKYTLNDGHTYAIFFIITPRNGRVDPGNLGMMKAVLSSMKKGPVVGLVLNQVGKRDIRKTQDPLFIRPMLEVLRRGGANIGVLSKRGALVLADHEDGFSDDEVDSIQEYVLSFLSARKIRKTGKAKKFFCKFNEFFHLE